METGATVFCRHCGSTITAKTLVCPTCGRGQDVNSGKTSKAAMIVVIVLVAGFFGIAVLGILAAIAIPQFAQYRSKGGDASARVELMKARAACDSYIANNKNYPESLTEAGFKPAENVMVNYEREGESSYRVTAVHRNGRRVFAVTSQDPAKVYAKQKDAPDSEFKPLE
jgi:type IV pilus assembly protein PilA